MGIEYPDKESSKEVKKLLSDLRDSKGINRQILETRNIKANTELSIATLAKLKKDFWFNIIYIVFGFLLGFLPTLLSEDKTTKAIELMNTLIVEKNESKKEIQTDLNKMRLELSSLKKELDSLNNK